MLLDWIDLATLTLANLPRPKLTSVKYWRVLGRGHVLISSALSHLFCQDGRMQLLECTVGCVLQFHELLQWLSKTSRAFSKGMGISLELAHSCKKMFTLFTRNHFCI